MATIAFAFAAPDTLAAAAYQPVPTAPVWSLITLIVVVITGTLVAGCVLLHYETLRLLSYGLLRFHGGRRRRFVLLVLSLLLLAIVEIWLFGLGYYGLLSDPRYGAMQGAGVSADQLLDYVYLSAMIHTTLGLGDLVPSGSIRFLVGTQAIVGFTLISWSAAFTFLEMEHFWRDNTKPRHRDADRAGHREP